MLKYFTDVTQAIVAMCALLGLLSAYVGSAWDRRGKKIYAVGAGAGFALGLIVTLLRQWTKLWDKSGGTGMWNVRTFTLSTLALIAFFVFSTGKPGKREDWPKPAREISGAVLAFTLIFYAFPTVFAYPFSFNLNGDTLLSTAFFYRLIGYILGLLLCFLVFLAMERVGRKAELKTLFPLLAAALVVNGVQQILKGLQVLHGKRIVSGHFIFELVKFSSSHSNLFIYLILILCAVLPVVLWARSLRVNEPYSNPAEHRKIRARWRNIRRWSTTALACFVLSVVTLTALTALANREVELSPAEDPEIGDDSVYVALENVEDGHLHRFAYTTKDDVTVRFIVIKKPNGTAYGVGLDACDICGETGYYERGGQVVCNLCDVVMNINTIGFKGGCNPIVIDYSIENGYIRVPFSTLEEHQDEFTR